MFGFAENLNPRAMISQPEALRRIPSLDGLRALAVMGILLAHDTFYAPFPWAALVRTVAGPLSVQVFFVLSGFLITTLLLRERSQTGTIAVRRFYLRRALRILPVFYAFVLVIVLLEKFGSITLPRGNLWFVLTYTVNYQRQGPWWTGHLWSLSVEEQFYLIWPLMMRFFRLQVNVIAALFLVGIAPAIRALLPMVDAARHPVFRLLFPDAAFPLVADAIACGCLLAVALPSLATKSAFRGVVQSPLAFLLLPVLLWLHHAAAAPGWASLPAGLAGMVYALSGVTAVNAAIALGVAKLTLFPACIVGRPLNSRSLVWIGALSYSIYVWQQIFINPGAHTWLQRPPFNLLFTLAAACLSYYGLERPVLGPRRRLRGTAGSTSGSWLRRGRVGVAPVQPPVASFAG